MRPETRSRSLGGKNNTGKKYKELQGALQVQSCRKFTTWLKGRSIIFAFYFGLYYLKYYVLDAEG